MLWPIVIMLYTNMCTSHQVLRRSCTNYKKGPYHFLVIGSKSSSSLVKLSAGWGELRAVAPLLLACRPCKTGAKAWETALLTASWMLWARSSWAILDGGGLELERELRPLLDIRLARCGWLALAGTYPANVMWDWGSYSYLVRYTGTWCGCDGTDRKSVV